MGGVEGDSTSLPFRPRRFSDRDNVEAVALALQFELLSLVTSGGRRQWQQWEVRSHGMRHYNNKGNLKVNRRASRWKP